MSEIQGVNGCSGSYKADLNKELQEKNIELEDISILYTTEQTEDKRSTFDDTYDKTSLNDATQGAKFLEGLKSNKADLAEDLGLTEEQYDALACIALALASQETGMGFEEGFVSENTGVGGALRKFMKWADVNLFGGASASSGLTQMKIYDFMNSDKLTQDQKDILTEYGIDVDGVATNNLYKEPDKAAIATMVVLKSLVDNYSVYTDKLSDEHSKITFNDGLTDAQRIQKGDDILAGISDVYANANDSTKQKIRSTFKQWLLSTEGNKDKNYNEAHQLGLLNGLLSAEKSSMTIKQSDLDYIRYTLTASGNEMTETEYCAYAWNKGTGDSGMTLDRLLADKIGTILANPEDFDYDQFTVNVASLAEKYAEQSVDGDAKELLNDVFDEES